MASLVDLDLRPDRRALRQFGFLALAGFGALAAAAWTESLLFSAGLGHARPLVAGGLLGLGALSALLSLVAPAANRPLYVGLALLAFPIGLVVSYAILAILFYGLITPVGLLFRLAGRDPMKRRFEHEAPTYWVEARRERPRESYFRQF